MYPKTIYAQSSDIKSRTYLQYRKDMKKKAIAELEILDWLKKKIKLFYPNKKVSVKKSGGDAFLWFLRDGNISREPDFEIQVEKELFFLEFQYADKENLTHYDFKVSKIGKLKNKKRIPYNDRNILYIFKQSAKYAIISPKWILKNGEYGMVPAWRSYAFRVPKDKFLKLFKKDKSLETINRQINIKNFILDFQHQLIDINQENLSHLLQIVVDEKKIVKIIPNNLESFFKICFVLDNLNKVPENANIWLVYVLSYLDTKINTEKLSKILYCVDFLYSKITKLNDHELNLLIGKIKLCYKLIQKFEQKNGTSKSSLNLSPKDEIRFALFSINLLEDLTQDIIHYYKIKGLKPIQKIYQTLNYIEKVYQNIV